MPGIVPGPISIACRLEFPGAGEARLSNSGSLPFRGSSAYAVELGLLATSYPTASDSPRIPADRRFCPFRAASGTGFPSQVEPPLPALGNCPLRPVYVISLLNFSLKHDSQAALEDGYVSRYELRNRHNGELMTEALHFVFVEMGRLPYGKDEWGKCRSKLEKFIFLFKFVHTFEQLPAGIREDGLLGMLAGAAEFANMSVLQKEEYDKAMKDEFARLVENNYAWSQGKEEGEERKSLEIASKLIEMGMEISDVSKATGLSPEQLEALRG